MARELVIVVVAYTFATGGAIGTNIDRFNPWLTANYSVGRRLRKEYVEEASRYPIEGDPVHASEHSMVDGRNHHMTRVRTGGESAMLQLAQGAGKEGHARADVSAVSVSDLGICKVPKHGENIFGSMFGARERVCDGETLQQGESCDTACAKWYKIPSPTRIWCSCGPQGDGCALQPVADSADEAPVMMSYLRCPVSSFRIIATFSFLFLLCCGAPAMMCASMSIQRKRRQQMMEDEQAKAPVITQLTEYVFSGSTQLNVASQEGFTVGSLIKITDAENSEINSIVAFGSLILAAPLVNSYSAGAVVMQMAKPQAASQAALKLPPWSPATPDRRKSVSSFSAQAARGKKKLEETQANLFMERWDAYKAVANNAIGDAKNQLSVKADGALQEFDVDGDGMIGPSEYDAMEQSIAEAWKSQVDAQLAKQAEKVGKTVGALQDDFVQSHIGGIEAKGYVLDAEAKECLRKVLERFFICDVGPAPFSVHTAEELQGNSLEENCVSVSQHCLQMAMHWLRNPPEMLSVPELEELVVLSLFHDVYYYDDFTHHAELTVKMMESFLLHEVPKAVVGNHIHLKPDSKALQNMQFDSPLEALKQEWVQMDWYLTLVNVKQEATRSKRVGDGVVAPLDFFHHHLGHVFTKGKHQVIHTAQTKKAQVRASITGTAMKDKAKMEPDQANLFMERWDAYKNVANNAIGDSKQNLSMKADSKFLSQFDVDGDGMIGPSEYDAMEKSIADAWKARVDAELAKQAQKAAKTVSGLQQEFVRSHITGIEAKGYVLSAEAKECLRKVLERFFICDVGPAPFSVHTVEELNAASVEDSSVSVSQHCLQMAMHWLRNPPEFLSVPELEELVVLSLFHDVYYYDDFTHHSELTVKMMEPFLLHEVPKAVVGDHINLKPDAKALQTMQFASPIEALKQEWVQMDWYLTLVNVKQEATRSKRVGDGVVAPLDFFHHHLGQVFTKGKHQVIHTAQTQGKNW